MALQIRCVRSYLLQSRNYFFIELEYVESGTLFQVQDHMPNHRFPIDIARFYCAEVASALEHVHEREVIYRDLKPENVMVDAGMYIFFVYDQYKFQTTEISRDCYCL